MGKLKMILALSMSVVLGVGIAHSPAQAQAVSSATGWNELPNTQIRTVCPSNGFGGSGYPFASSCQSVTLAWSSGAFDTNRNRLYVFGGGHTDYYGNEVYAIDLNDGTTKRLTNPSIPVATSCVESLSNPTGPNSRHTYDGMTYMTNQDRLFLVSGGSLACGPGSVSVNAWLFNPNTNTWQGPLNPGGDSLLMGFNPSDIETTAAAYDSVTGLVMIDNRIGLLTYDFSTNTYKLRNNLGGTSRPANSTSIVDPIHRYYYVIGCGQMYRWDISNLNSVPSPTIISSSGGSAIVGECNPGLAWDTTNQKVVGWTGGNTVYTLNATTNAWTAVTFSGGPSAAANGTYKRFSYSPNSGVFVVANSVDSPAYVLRLSAGSTSSLDTTAPSIPTGVTSTAPSPTQVTLSWTPSTDNVVVSGYEVYRNSTKVGTATQPSYTDINLNASTTYTYAIVAFDATGNKSAQSSPSIITTPPLSSGVGSNFSTRCSQPGVLVCQGWDQASSMTPAVYPNSGIYPGDAGTYANATRDTGTFMSGSGALRLRHPAGVASPNTTGDWRQSFGRTFSQNSHFYVQYAMRISPEYSSNTLQWNSQWKHSIIYGGIQSPTCASIELTTVNYNYSDHPDLWPQMYTDCGQRSMYTKTDNQTYTNATPLLLQSTSQPGVRGYSCQYGSQFNGTGNGSGCFNLSQLTNKWITFYYDIEIGSWDTATSKIKAYIALDGGPYLQWINVTNMTLFYNNSPSDGYGAITLTPYMTGLSTPAPADAYMWFDDLIISSQPIAAPGSVGTSDLTPPATPSNLRIQ